MTELLITLPFLIGVTALFMTSPSRPRTAIKVLLVVQAVGFMLFAATGGTDCGDDCGALHYVGGSVAFLIAPALLLASSAAALVKQYKRDSAGPPA